MGTTDTPLSGPDFTTGIPFADLSDGGHLLGHAQGEAVLLSRRGDDAFAIGATCSHYGGPLAEGLVEGDTVRCPWHHACFNIRTGEALAAPALSPVPCYTVERRGNTVYVANKEARGALAATYPMPSSASRSSAARSATSPVRRVVIVGAGAAGAAGAEMLRRCGYDGAITMVDSDTDAPYDRPNLSKDYLAGNAPEEWIPLRPDGVYAEHGIEVVRAPAARIDREARVVEVTGHDALPYDALLLATGAEPVRLPVEGADLPHVHYLRSLDDSRAIIAAAKSARHVVVIGASFIGLEVAAALNTRGLPVQVVSPEDVPLGRILGPELGGVIRSLHEEKGVIFHFERKPLRIERDTVVLDDDRRVLADLVVIGVGVRPRLDLAERAGLTMDRGVRVNEYLETSAPGIYAAGDIARWPDPHSGEHIRVEHWVVAQRMGQVAARNILGAREPFVHVPYFWSAHYDMAVSYVGHAESWDTLHTDGSAAERNLSVRYERDGKLLALATIVRDRESLRTELAMERDVATAPLR